MAKRKASHLVSQAARTLGAIGGRSVSPLKRAASRINGKMGGRPLAHRKGTRK